eukprot:GHVU01154246.1.p6 GENE.GHVU01154246.1~~GHVU01154246.1.p6  ORF type:complete len:107 (-),score=10.26 GHVU01154246.1:257-577(-)
MPDNTPSTLHVCTSTNHFFGRSVPFIHDRAVSALTFHNLAAIVTRPVSDFVDGTGPGTECTATNAVNPAVMAGHNAVNIKAAILPMVYDCLKPAAPNTGTRNRCPT